MHDTATTLAARRAIVADYLRARAQGGDVLMLAGTRTDVALLNLDVRAWLFARGQLSDEVVITGGRNYRVGDEVILTRNDHARGLLNGTRAQVIAIDPYRRALTITTRDGHAHHLDAAYLADSRLDHGYALTVHKAQGLTVDVALLYAGTQLSAEAGYVALSRGRTANHVYLASAPEAGRPDRDTRARLTAELAHHRQHTLATDLLHRRPGQVDRGYGLSR